MSTLPRGWKETPLGQIAALQGGSTPKGVLSAPPGAIPFYKVGDMNRSSGHFMDEARVTVAPPTADSLGLRVCPAGTVIFPKVGGAIHTNKKRVLSQPAAFDTNTMGAIPSDALYAPYLFYWLSSIRLADFAYGAPIPQVSRARLSEHPFLLPPRSEQKRIVAAIEEQFSRLDAGVAALERVRERLRLLRDKGLLALVSASGDLQRLGDVAEIRLGRQRSPKNHTGPRLRPYLRAANVTWNGLDLRDVKLMNFSSPESSIYELQRGDVLVAEASGSASEVGKPAIWDGSIANCCFQNTLLRVRSDRFLPEYLYFVLLAHARGGTFARASRGVGIHHLSKSGLSGLAVTLPALAQQEAIVGRARSLQTAVARLLNDVEKQSARVRTLRSAILAAAFSGNLVLQDPNDEPASALLERIAAERASSNGHKPTRVGKPRTTRPKVPA